MSLVVCWLERVLETALFHPVSYASCADCLNDRRGRGGETVEEVLKALLCHVVTGSHTRRPPHYRMLYYLSEGASTDPWGAPGAITNTTVWLDQVRETSGSSRA